MEVAQAARAAKQLSEKRKMEVLRGQRWLPEQDERLRRSSPTRDGWRFEDQGLPTVNSRVEANFGNQGRYYGGVISAANDDGTFQVQYDDGDFEASVLRSNMRIS